MITADSSIKLSVIVPCYKVEKYLPACLDSLINQTLDDIEIICINDGSPDGCIDILRSYEAANPGKVVVIDKKNEGVWRGRFDGIRIARGEYIGFVDSDDTVAPNFAEILYRVALSGLISTPIRFCRLRCAVPARTSLLARNRVDSLSLTELLGIRRSGQAFSSP